MKLDDRDSIEGFLALAFGVGFGAILVYAIGRLPGQWTSLLIAASVGVSGVILLSTLTAQLRNALLMAALFSAPIFYDINFLFRENTRFFVQANGLTVSLFDVPFLALFGLWLINIFLSKPGAGGEFRSVEPTVFWLLFLILLFNLISSAFVTPIPFYGFSMLSWNVKMIMLFLFLYNNVSSEGTVRLIVYGFAAVLMGQGLVVLEQTFVGTIFTAENLNRDVARVSQLGQSTISRAAGTIGHPNDLAMFLNLLLPTVIFFFLIERGFWRRSFLVLAVLLAVIAEIGTASRGGWTGLLAGMLCAVFALLHKRGFNLVTVAAVGSFVVSSIVLLLFVVSETLRNRLTQDDHGTADVRYPLMDVAYNMIGQNPFWGVGLNSYAATMGAYDRTPESISTEFPVPVHNTYLLIAAEVGIPAMLLWVLFLGFCLYRCYQVFRNSSGVVELASLGVLGGVVTWLVHNLVNLDSVFTNYMLWVLLGTIFALQAMVTKKTS